MNKLENNKSGNLVLNFNIKSNQFYFFVISAFSRSTSSPINRFTSVVGQHWIQQEFLCTGLFPHSVHQHH